MYKSKYAAKISREQTSENTGKHTQKHATDIEDKPKPEVWITKQRHGRIIATAAPLYTAASMRGRE